MTGNNPIAAEQHEPVSLELWQRLYAAAAQVQQMEPWLWMEETDIFGVKDPDGDTILFVSVMGLLGEYHAIGLYVGAKALTQFWHMQQASGAEETAQHLLDIRQIHVAFGSKRELETQEKDVIKELGLTFKGTHAWPHFRSFRPGWFPWLLDAREARWLLLTLEQLLDVAPRIKENRRLVSRKPGTCTYLVRVSRQHGETQTWSDESLECPPPPTTFRLEVPMRLLNAVRAIAPSDRTLELDIIPSPTLIGKKGERPQRPYVMMAVDSESGFILGIELLTVKQEIEDMWAQVPSKVLAMIEQHGIRPGKLALRTPWVSMVMDGICKELGIKAYSAPELPSLTRARRDMKRAGLPL